jgi:hypothetical protein
LSASAAKRLSSSAADALAFPTRMPVILIVRPDGKAVAHNASTGDCSDQGARIRTAVDLGVGEAIGIVAYERRRETVPCRAVWVGTFQTDGSREGGIGFLRGSDS